MRPGAKLKKRREEKAGDRSSSAVRHRSGEKAGGEGNEGIAVRSISASIDIPRKKKKEGEGALFIIRYEEGKERKGVPDRDDRVTSCTTPRAVCKGGRKEKGKGGEKASLALFPHFLRRGKEQREGEPAASGPPSSTPAAPELEKEKRRGRRK